MKYFLFLVACSFLVGCSAGTLTVTKKNGNEKIYRVLDCNMKEKGKITYTGLDGQKHVVTDYQHALFENRFTTNEFGIEPHCCGK